MKKILYIVITISISLNVYFIYSNYKNINREKTIELIEFTKYMANKFENAPMKRMIHIDGDEYMTIKQSKLSMYKDGKNIEDWFMISSSMGEMLISGRMYDYIKNEEVRKVMNDRIE
jgi:hypothetical protein